MLKKKCGLSEAEIGSRLGLCQNCCWKRGEPTVVQRLGRWLDVKIRCKAVENGTTLVNPIAAAANECPRKAKALAQRKRAQDRERKSLEEWNGVERRKKPRKPHKKAQS